MADLDRDPIDLHLDMVAAAMAEQARHLDALVAELRRLRAENAALAAALEDIAGMLPVATTPDGIGVWIADAECCRMDRPCHQAAPSDTGEWCPVCVAEVAWCAWKMGVLGS